MAVYKETEEYKAAQAAKPAPKRAARAPGAPRAPGSPKKTPKEHAEQRRLDAEAKKLKEKEEAEKKLMTRKIAAVGRLQEHQYLKNFDFSVIPKLTDRAKAIKFAEKLEKLRRSPCQALTVGLLREMESRFAMKLKHLVQRIDNQKHPQAEGVKKRRRDDAEEGPGKTNAEKTEKGDAEKEDANEAAEDREPSPEHRVPEAASQEQEEVKDGEPPAVPPASQPDADPAAPAATGPREPAAEPTHDLLAKALEEDASEEDDGVVIVASKVSEDAVAAYQQRVGRLYRNPRDRKSQAKRPRLSQPTALTPSQPAATDRKSVV
eukprot:TRINITY_DN30146_c0_g2_i1.p1 TRINITY_DN30146_c0_g2~~TRINITY_DN30146_c0_g2_i1.p1  ORF type:complete len:356 (+),score=77.20 TRINITY_DN30146_c0_g2_i1:111-1070(+)